jgi:hypothetical protein
MLRLFSRGALTHGIAGKGTFGTFLSVFYSRSIGITLLFPTSSNLGVFFQYIDS